MYYSNSLGTFYDPQTHGAEFPDDAIELTDDEFQALMLGQAMGKLISIGEDGKPVLIDAPPQLFYAKSTGKFYDTRLQGDPVPADAVEIDEDYYLDLFAGQSLGKVISADEFGRPVLIDPPAPTADEILAANTAMLSGLQAQASQAMMPLLISLQLGDATEAETDLAKRWQAYSRTLKAVDLASHQPEWPELPA